MTFCSTSRSIPLIAALLVASLAGCGESSRPPNLVLLVADTLRHDHIGCYGAVRDTSPVIDALASEGVRFEYAHSTAPWTNPAMASILSGQFPRGHGLRQPLHGLAGEVLTLAEMLKAEGYRTAGIVSNPHLTAKHGFHQGFDTYLQSEARGRDYISTDGVTAQAIDVITEFSKSDDPFFLFVLYFEPHYTYMRHPEYGFAAPQVGRLTGEERINRLRNFEPALESDEIQLIVDIYDEEVRYMDAGIGRLFEALRRHDLYDDCVIAFTADHGEEFFERGWLGHARTLYEELVRVPLVIKAPNAKAPRVVQTPVSLVSIAPTFVDLARGTDGLRNSLVPILGGATPEAGPIFCEVNYVPLYSKQDEKEAHKRAVLLGDHKLVRDDESGAVELYHLPSDPEERRNLAEEKPDLAQKLLVILERETRMAETGALQGSSVDLTEEELEVLRSLGYTGSDRETEDQ